MLIQQTKVTMKISTAAQYEKAVTKVKSLMNAFPERENAANDSKIAAVAKAIDFGDVRYKLYKRSKKNHPNSSNSKKIVIYRTSHGYSTELNVLSHEITRMGSKGRGQEILRKRVNPAGFSVYLLSKSCDPCSRFW